MARCQGAALREVGGRLACSFWMQEPPASVQPVPGTGSGKAVAGR